MKRLSILLTLLLLFPSLALAGSYPWAPYTKSGGVLVEPTEKKFLGLKNDGGTFGFVDNFFGNQNESATWNQDGTWTFNNAVTFNGGTTGVSFATQYASLDAAITAIGSTKTTLVVASSLPVVGNVTVPATLTLFFYENGNLSIPTGKVVTFSNPGQIMAPLQQIFTGSGTVTFTYTSGKAYPHWWGADPTGVASSSSAFTLACNAISVLYLAGGTFTLAGVNEDNCPTWHGEGATIQGDGDLLNGTNFFFDNITLKNITTKGKLFTLNGTGRFTCSFCTFLYANYHIYNASGFTVNSRCYYCRFGGGSVGTGAAIYSRYFDGLNDYIEDAYTWYNNQGLYFQKGTSVELSGTFEYQTGTDIVVNVTAGQALSNLAVRNLHLEAPGAKAVPYVSLTSNAGSNLVVTFDNVHRTATASTDVIDAVGGGTLSASFLHSAELTSSFGGSALVYTDANDRDSGVGYAISATNLTVVGGTGLTYTTNFVRRGPTVSFTVIIHANGGTTASTIASTYLTATIVGGVNLPVTSVISSLVGVHFDNNDHTAGPGFVTSSGGNIRIFLPTWAAIANDVQVSGMYFVQ